MIKKAYTHGRYQPLHKGHFTTFLEILKEFDKLWIGIANPERKMPDNLPQDPKLIESVTRARKKENNPFSYEQRKEMIMKSFQKVGIDLSRIKVSPHYSFYDNEGWLDFMPSKDTTIVLAAKDKHHFAKLEKYKKLGFKTKTLPQVLGLTGAKFRQAWKEGKWEELVPEGTKEVIIKKQFIYK